MLLHVKKPWWASRYKYDESIYEGSWKVPNFF